MFPNIENIESLAVIKIKPFAGREWRYEDVRNPFKSFHCWKPRLGTAAHARNSRKGTNSNIHTILWFEWKREWRHLSHARPGGDGRAVGGGEVGVPHREPQTGSKSLELWISFTSAISQQLIICSFLLAVRSERGPRSAALTRHCRVNKRNLGFLAGLIL